MVILIALLTHLFVKYPQLVILHAEVHYGLPLLIELTNVL
jgi:hypothetical protein